VKTAYLGLGSNLGDRLRTLREAAARLGRTRETTVTRASSVYQTAPVGLTDQPDFLNLVLEVRTGLEAMELLKHCLEIEAGLGRIRRERWGPRTIDIDLLWVEGVAVKLPELTLPHPRMVDRAFVLLPLAELAPQLLLAGESVEARVQKLADRGGVLRVGPFPLETPGASR